jgi:hypothetical protein
VSAVSPDWLTKIAILEGATGRFAVAELGRDVDVGGQARDLLEPVFRDMAGVGRRAAGDQRHPVDAV